jgi:HK97 family phage major capsid protein
MTFVNNDQAARERREQRDNHHAANEAIINRCQAENRNLTREEAAEFDTHEAAMKQLDRAMRAAEGYAGRGAQPVRRVAAPGEEKREAAFDRYVRFGEKSPELRTMYDAGLNESGFQDSGTAGGFMVAPGFWDNLQVALAAYGGFGEYYRQVPTSTGTPMSWPTSDPTAIEGHIIGEGVQDSYQDYTIGQGVLNAWTYTNKLILVSVELANDSAIDVQGFIADRIGEGIGRAQGAHSVSGSGTGQPLGLITALAATSGMSSGGYYTLGSATATNYVGGGDTTVTELVGNVLGPQTLAAMIKGVDSAYWPGCAWYFSPEQLVNEQNLSDGFGRPLYPTLQQANPTLLGFPVRVVATAPACLCYGT